MLTAGAIKAFAREVCRNDVLNFGRLHFFFPDSRLSLDLNTDRTLKEARFDRHFVRDLTWSRHQLEELAERRFRAAQEALQAEAQANGKTTELVDTSNTTFADLFRKVLVGRGVRGNDGGTVSRATVRVGRDGRQSNTTAPAMNTSYSNAKQPINWM